MLSSQPMPSTSDASTTLAACTVAILAGLCLAAALLPDITALPPQQLVAGQVVAQKTIVPTATRHVSTQRSEGSSLPQNVHHQIEHQPYPALPQSGYSPTKGLALFSSLTLLTSTVVTIAAYALGRWLQGSPAQQPLLRTSKSVAMGAVTSDRPQTTTIKEEEVLDKLRRIIDPDLGMDIVSCGFVKNLSVDADTGSVGFVLELTTPACPVKGEFERAAKQNVSELSWVKDVKVVMDAQVPQAPSAAEFPGLSKVANIIAVASCKGGVGKSTVAVNLAYALAQMGARVGIFDADIYGPSLPTMISPSFPMHEMDPETRALTPVEYEGVKGVSFGFLGQGSAIMRGPMVSGVVQQLLTTTNWGELEYLVIDMPPGTGDIQLTLGQVVQITAAVIVTTPQNLAFVDVAKGIRMFSRLRVPCISVVENMAYYDVAGQRVQPFGTGSGKRIAADFGVPHLFQLPIDPAVSKAGDSGKPHVLADLNGPISRTFSDLGVAVVQEVAKLRRLRAPEIEYDEATNVITFRTSPEEGVRIPAYLVRRADRSAASIDEWTGKLKVNPEDIPETVRPISIQGVGNYAVQIAWDDGFSQISPFEQLIELGTPF